MNPVRYGKQVKSRSMEIAVRDIGEFSKVPVVSVLVSVGDKVLADDPLIELESDKATMEVAATVSGIVSRIDVQEGDEVSEGSVILAIDVADENLMTKTLPALVGSGRTAAAATAGYGSAAGVQAVRRVCLPDIGAVNRVPVVSILVAPGDRVSVEDPLIELKSASATIKVPSPAEGTVIAIAVKEGENVREGALILTLSTSR